MAWWKFGGVSGSPIAMVRRVARVRTFVQVHVEGQSLSFRTVIALRGRRVILARPKSLESEIASGTTLRVYHHETPDVGFRLHVVQPQFLLSNGNSVIVADLPDELVEACRRVHDRFDTARFPGLRLVTPEPRHAHHVLDLSLRGCRVRVDRGMPPDVLPLERPLRDAVLMIGRQQVTLERLIPVDYAGDTVGCYLEPVKEGASSRVLSHLISRLTADAKARHRVNPSV